MRLRSTLPFLLFATLLGVAQPSAAREDVLERDVWLTATAVVDASGHVATLEWSEGDALQELATPRVDAVVRAWEFVPGRLDGVPAETRTQLTVHLKAKALPDGALGLTLLDAKTGVFRDRFGRPGYPDAALRNLDDGHVVLELAIDAAGKASITRLDVEATGSRRNFEDYFRKAVAGWTFSPETVGGHGVPAQVQYVATFCARESGKLSWCDKRKTKPRDALADGMHQFDSALTLKTDVRDVRI